MLILSTGIIVSKTEIRTRERLNEYIVLLVFCFVVGTP